MGHFSEGKVRVWFLQLHTVNSSCAEGSLVFSDAGKALQLKKIILKFCDICVNCTNEHPSSVVDKLVRYNNVPKEFISVLQWSLLTIF